jgi:hypothetical protein
MFVLASGQANAQTVDLCNTLTIGSLTGSNVGPGNDPTTVTGDVPVTAPDPVAMAGTLTNTITSTTPPHPVTCGPTANTGANQAFEWATDVNGAATTCALGTFSPNGFFVPDTDFLEGTNVGSVTDSNGTLTRNFLTDNFGGQIIGFRAAHSNDAGANDSTGSLGHSTSSFSPCIDVNITAAASNSPCDTVANNGALIVLTQVGGPGNGTVGQSADWHYGFTIYACQAITLQSAQGGTSGWTTYDTGSATASPTNCSWTASTNKTNKNGATTVLLCEWGTLSKKSSYTSGISLTAGQTVNITLSETGAPPAGSSGTQLPLNGDWSALFCLGATTTACGTTSPVLKTLYTNAPGLPTGYAYVDVQ